MATTPTSDLWNAMLSAFGRAPRHAELVLDTTLLVALADGPLTLARRDALARVVDCPKGPLPRDWSTVQHRTGELQANRPLVAALREEVRSGLGARTPHVARVALQTAARISLAGGPLSDAERALFLSVAEDAGEERPQDYLQTLSYEDRAALRYARAPFNDPAGPAPETLFEAVAEAKEEAVVRILVFKLVAIRHVLETRFEDVEPRVVHEVGTLHPTSHGQLRIDGELLIGGDRVCVRALAEDEALYPGEAEALGEFAESLSPEDRVIVAHEGPLSPADREVAGHGASRVERFALPRARR